MSHLLGWTMFGASIILLLGAVGVGAITYERAYADRIFPGVRIGSIPVGELTKADATSRVQKVIDAYFGNGISYALDGKMVTVNPLVSAPQDPDIAYEIIDVDTNTLVDAAFAIGRRPSLTAAWSERVRGAIRDEQVVPIDATIDAERLALALTENLRTELQPMELPTLVANTEDGTVRWTIRDGRAGRTLDREAIRTATALRVATLDPAAIPLTTIAQEPPFTTAAIEAVLPAIDTALTRAPLTLTHEQERWMVTRDALATWITLDERAQPTLDAHAIAKFLTPIARTVEVTAENARLTIDPATKRVREFQSARLGTRIDRDALATSLHAAVFGTAPPLIPIPIIEAAPAVALGDTNDLGIRELLGAGKTSFKGSPANRRHNIGIGTSLLNGLLIAPGEEFSTVGALSPFDGSRGYRPELVIKGNKTTPEFGGGLCQVSTTLFRAVLAAGLPITARTNHAYRVPYYEPPLGMDATIYGPKPDFQFRNDTPAYILIRARVVGDMLEYEFWGTKDGRVATSSEPEVFNYVAPPPMATIETEDLKPGEKKCTERAHTGVDAKFTYTVAYADGRKEERVFKSHYRPWQAVCLVGKKPTADSPQPAPTQTSGPQATNPDASTPSAPESTVTPTPDVAPPPVAPPSPTDLTVGGSN